MRLLKTLRRAEVLNIIKMVSSVEPCGCGERKDTRRAFAYQNAAEDATGYCIEQNLRYQRSPITRASYICGSDYTHRAKQTFFLIRSK